jgi:DEAD/DEAH box helicase domain-containing protein
LVDGTRALASSLESPLGGGRDRLGRLLDALQADARFVRNVTAWQTLPGRPAALADWPSELDPHLIAAAAQQGIDRLYTHQADAVSAALRGEHIVQATGTASGKTLGYILPVLHTLWRDPEGTALLLYPTKALAHDQMAMWQGWIDALSAAEGGPAIPLHPYDGDTPSRHRSAIRQSARILVSNPDMLHLGILPHHTRWMRFFQGLRYVVLDELHTYRGVFGSHVANVLRRLARIAAFYGASPHYLSASATIANPQTLAESLCEAPVTPVVTDGAAYGMRHVIFYNPPLVDADLGLRASAAGEALDLAVRLLEADVQTIIFARSRLSVELLLRDLRLRALDLGLTPEVVQGYRGGYLPQERRAIEKGLRTGVVRTVVATNALELGIDIGNLEAAVLVGYPGSIAATRQQMGRAGRRAGMSLAIMVATAAPVDQYLVAHPEYVFGRSPEEARINPDGLSLLASHLVCAAFELPFDQGAHFGRRLEVGALLEALAAEGILHRSGQRITWVGESYPAQAVSLRTATADNIVIRTADGGVIGTVDRPSAPRMVYEGAVYFHGAAAYLIDELDWEQGIAHARPAELDYFTVAAATVRVERQRLRRCLPVDGPTAGGLARTEEDVIVYTKPTAYRRVHLSTRETLGWGEIALPEQQMETEACRLILGPAVVEALADEGVMVAPLDYGPEWAAIRQTVLSRDAYRCRLCGQPAVDGRPLEVHHLTPLRTFMAQYARPMAYRLAHAPENLLSLCPVCHRQVERARGARTALGGLGYLLRHLAPVFLMCDPGDLGATVEARDRETGQPVVILYDEMPGGAGLTPRLVDLWPQLAEAARARVQACPCTGGCPACVGPVGESEPGAKGAALRLLDLLAAAP